VLTRCYQGKNFIPLRNERNYGGAPRNIESKGETTLPAAIDYGNGKTIPQAEIAED